MPTVPPRRENSWHQVDVADEDTCHTTVATFGNPRGARAPSEGKINIKGCALAPKFGITTLQIQNSEF